jgi:hypothetical protein
VPPISDPNYFAAKQKKYRERVKHRTKITEFLGTENQLGMYLERACFACVSKALIPTEPQSYQEFIEKHWPDDDITPYVTRAVVPPAMTSDVTMGALLTEVLADFVASLAPISASANLFANAVHVTLDGAYTVRLPRRSGPIDVNDVAWIAEGGAIPVPVLSLENVVIGPVKKMAAIIPYTRELAEKTNAEEVFTRVLRETAALQLDATAFSNQAATPARPAGILNGIAPLTPAGAGDTTMITDLGKLAGAIGTVTSGLAYVAHPNQVNAIRLRYGATWSADIPLWPTLGVAAGTVIALDPAAFATAYGPDPSFDTTDKALIQTNDNPTTNVMASGPTLSLFQADMVALRLLLEAAWNWRLAGAVAWMQNVTW